MGKIRYTKDFPQIPASRRLICFLIGLVLRLFFGGLRRTIRVGEVNLNKLVEAYPDRPIFFYSWHKHTMTACFAAASGSEFNRVRILFHDGLKSFMWIGTGGLGEIQGLVFSFRGAKSPSEQIIEALEPGMMIGTHPDSGGPYQKMRPGLVKIAQKSGAVLIPITFNCDREWKFRRLSDHRLPKPFATISVKIGTPVSITGDLVADTVLAEESLNELERTE